MPKMKTHRGAAKRFRRTSTGFKHKQTNKNHILTKKAPKRKAAEVETAAEPEKEQANEEEQPEEAVAPAPTPKPAPSRRSRPFPQ